MIQIALIPEQMEDVERKEQESEGRRGQPQVN
jgi:hypothetical protein